MTTSSIQGQYVCALSVESPNWLQLSPRDLVYDLESHGCPIREISELHRQVPSKAHCLHRIEHIHVSGGKFSTQHEWTLRDKARSILNHTVQSLPLMRYGIPSQKLVVTENFRCPTFQTLCNRRALSSFRIERMDHLILDCELTTKDIFSEEEEEEESLRHAVTGIPPKLRGVPFLQVSAGARRVHREHMQGRLKGVESVDTSQQSLQFTANTAFNRKRLTHANRLPINHTPLFAPSSRQGCRGTSRSLPGTRGMPRNESLRLAFAPLRLMVNSAG